MNIAVMAMLAVAGLASLALLWRWALQRQAGSSLPRQWPVVARPLLSKPELALYRAAQLAFPQWTAVPKAPLSRLLRLQQAQDAQGLYQLIAPQVVTLVLFGPDFMPLHCIDLVSEEQRGRDAFLIKQRALAAAQIPYLAIAPDALVSPGSLTEWLLHESAAAAEPATQGTTQSASQLNSQLDFHSTASHLKETIDSLRARRSRGEPWDDTNSSELPSELPAELTEPGGKRRALDVELH